MDDELFEVSRKEYEILINQIKPGCAKIVEDKERGWKIYKVFSVQHGTYLACRKVSEERATERYFIFETPAMDETQFKAYTNVTLTEPEQVQKLMDYIKQESKKHG